MKISPILRYSAVQRSRWNDCLSRDYLLICGCSRSKIWFWPPTPLLLGYNPPSARFRFLVNCQFGIQFLCYRGWEKEELDKMIRAGLSFRWGVYLSPPLLPLLPLLHLRWYLLLICRRNLSQDRAWSILLSFSPTTLDVIFVAIVWKYCWQEYLVVYP